jgi:hypothetical protein
MFAETGEGHREGLGGLRDAGGAAREAIEDGATRGIGDGGSDPVEGAGIILNHTVHYRRARQFLSTAIGARLSVQGQRNKIDSN